MSSSLNSSAAMHPTILLATVKANIADAEKRLNKLNKSIDAASDRLNNINIEIKEQFNSKEREIEIFKNEASAKASKADDKMEQAKAIMSDAQAIRVRIDKEQIEISNRLEAVIVREKACTQDRITIDGEKVQLSNAWNQLHKATDNIKNDKAEADKFLLDAKENLRISHDKRLDITRNMRELESLIEQNKLLKASLNKKIAEAENIKSKLGTKWH